MSVGEWALIASVVFAGLWSGLLAMVTTVLHPMMKPMDGSDFARFLLAFLPTARKAPFNFIAVIGMIVAPVVALFALDTGSDPFLLTAIGLAFVLIGPLAVSNRMAEPLYDEMLSWDPARPPGGWEAGRRRYFTINWIRAGATWSAFGLFLAALVDRA